MPHTVTAANASHWMSQNGRNKPGMRGRDVLHLNPFGNLINYYYYVFVVLAIYFRYLHTIVVYIYIYRVCDVYASSALVVVMKMFLDSYIYITIKLNNKCKLLNINNINNIIYI